MSILTRKRLNFERVNMTHNHEGTSCSTASLVKYLSIASAVLICMENLTAFVMLARKLTSPLWD